MYLVLAFYLEYISIINYQSYFNHHILHHHLFHHHSHVIQYSPCCDILILHPVADTYRRLSKSFLPCCIHIEHFHMVCHWSSYNWWSFGCSQGPVYILMELWLGTAYPHLCSIHTLTDLISEAQASKHSSTICFKFSWKAASVGGSEQSFGILLHPLPILVFHTFALASLSVLQLFWP